MKILYCCHADNYHIKKWAPLLAEKGLQVHIATFQPDSYSQNAIQTHSMPIFFDKISYLDFLFSGKKIARIAQSVQPDLMFCSFALTYGLGGVLSGFKPLVIQTWSRDIAAPHSVNVREWLMVKTIGAYVLGSADGITTDGYSFKKQLVKSYPCLEHKTLATPWGIKPDEFKANEVRTKEAKSALKINPEQNVLLSVRGVFWYYQPRQVLSMLREVAEQNPGVTVLVLTLEHERTRAIEALLVELKKYENIKIIDSLLSPDEMKTIWAAADFFISTPQFDGVSESVQEGCAAGAIPIINSIPSNNELMDSGMQAFTVNPSDDVNAFAEDVQKILHKPASSLEKMSKHNLEWVKDRGNVDKTVQRLIKFFEQLIKGK